MILYRVIILSFLFLMLAECEVKHASSKHHDESKDFHKVTEKDEHVDKLKIYQQLLKHKRLEQAAAVKNLIQLKDVDQQKKLVNELIASMIKLLRNAEELVKAAKFNSRLAKMPNDEKLQEHVSEVIENTPFFMELALYYPKLVNKFYLKEEIKDLINWAYRFSLDFNLYDELTMKMLDLAAQELLIIPRREDFINPYNKLAMREVLQAEVVAAAKEAKEKELTKKKEYMKKQKRNNGPSLSRGEL